MQIRQKRLDFGKRKTATIMYGSCWHYGNPSVHEEGIARFMQFAKRMPWWHVGDLVESILPDDKRFSIIEHKQTSLENVSVAAEAISKAYKTCWGLLVGNHEWKLAAKIGDVTEMICHDAKIDYLSQTAYITVQCPAGKAVIFTAHGRGMSNSRSSEPERDQLNRIIRLRNVLRPFRADLKAIGHFHRTIIAPQVLKHMGSPVEDKMIRRPELVREEWCCACPSMFKNYSTNTMGSYAEISLCEPTDLGWIEAVLERTGRIACIRSRDENGKVSQEVYPSVLS